jgi:HK97 gp10 family phage protein
MASTTVTVKSYRPQVEKKLEDMMRKNMEKVGAVVERQAKKNVTQTPPLHPQVDTGRLRSSIIHLVDVQGNTIAVSIGTNIFYGKHLELGTINHPPYPWLFVAVEMSKEKITEILGNKWTSYGDISNMD